MEDAVGAGEAYHGTGELTVFAVFIGESGGIEDASDLLIIFSVVAPLEPGFSSFDVEAKVDRFVLLVFKNSVLTPFSRWMMDNALCPRVSL